MLTTTFSALQWLSLTSRSLSSPSRGGCASGTSVRVDQREASQESTARTTTGPTPVCRWVSTQVALEVHCSSPSTHLKCLTALGELQAMHPNYLDSFTFTRHIDCFCPIFSLKLVCNSASDSGNDLRINHECKLTLLSLEETMGHNMAATV